MRYEEYLYHVIDDYLGSDTMDTQHFPEMDLYMDQVSSFMNKKLAIYKKDEQDIVITKTMIGNYVKHNMLPRPKNKKYGRDHLILLNLIYYLKSTFQMDEIEKLMKPIIDNYESEFDDKIDLELLYESIAKMQKVEQEHMAQTAMEDVENLKKTIKKGGLADDDLLELFTVIVNLSIKADFQRYLAQKLLHEYFPEMKKQK